MGASVPRQGTIERAAAGNKDSPVASEHCAVWFSQPPNSQAAWLLDISVQGFQGTARTSIGRIIVSPPDYGPGALPRNKRAARVVAMCSCPGAVQWFVDTTLLVDYDFDEENPKKDNSALAWIEASPHGPGVPIVALDGAVLPTRRYWYQADTAPGVVTLPVGLVLERVSVAAGPAGATVTLDPAFGAIPVPANRALNESPNYMFGPYAPYQVTIAGDVEAYFLQGSY